MLDKFYITVFNYYKKSMGKKSMLIASIYINILELSLYLALGSFFLAFATQMKIVVMSQSKFWMIFSIVVLIVVFKNWLRYNGKKRNVLNAKTKANKTSIYLLWLLPIGCCFIGYILLQA